MMLAMASLIHESDSKHLLGIIDSVPALIHTSRSDGYLDYFNQRWLDYLERSFFAMDISGPSGAAVKLGIPRSTLESRIRSLQINKHLFRSERRHTRHAESIELEDIIE
jgi:hypothetical protein